MALSIDRRAWIRHPAASDKSKVKLIDWAGCWAMNTQLINLSQEGGLIKPDGVLVPERAIWVYLVAIPELLSAAARD